MDSAAKREEYSTVIGHSAPMRYVSACALCALWLLLMSLSLPAQKVTPMKDTPFVQDYHEAFPLSSPAENDVRALAFDRDGLLWAATAAGPRCLQQGVWKTPAGGERLGQTYAFYCDSAGTMWIGAWNGLYRASAGSVLPAPLRETPIGAIRGTRISNDGKETIFAAGPEGIWKREGDAWKPLQGKWQSYIRAILPTQDNKLWIATASGLYLHDLNGVNRPTRHLARPKALLSSNVWGLTLLADGTLVIASTGGLDFYRDEKRVHSLSAVDGMPCREARAVQADAEGRLWVATRLGVARYTPASSPLYSETAASFPSIPAKATRQQKARHKGVWNLRHSRRWLQNDDARDVLIGADGTCWVATASGVDAIRRKSMTLEQKAAYFLEMLRDRHIRPPGLVGPAVLLKQGDLTQSFIEDDDNDGEHTGMYLAMESFRYAVTKDPQARENAKAAFQALVVLQQATGTQHFIARSVLPIGTPPRHEGDRTFTPEEIADSKRTDPREKIIEKRWIPTADGKWLWKRDASSDEVDGHLFGYLHYYDLAADEAEKRRVADQVDRIVGGIIDNGYVLQDVDGKATRWGVWSPERLNEDANWNEERPGNSTEILAYLGVAFHMTGKPRYREAAEYLIRKHRYDRNMRETGPATPSESTHINAELMSMVYPLLFQALILPSLQPAAQASIRNWYTTWKRDGIPFYDFVYHRFSGQSVSLDRAVACLRDWPLDGIEWTVDNSRREDVRRDLTPGLDSDRLAELTPRSEMGLCMWDQEPYRAVIGRDGMREDRPTDWLLAYWMGRYYGLLAAESAP